MKVLVCLAALFALVCFVSANSADEALVRVAHYEPVLDFTVNDAKDRLSFRAYNKEWQFAIWVSGVSNNEEESAGHFQGNLINNAESVKLASFTILENYITGMIIANNDTFWMEAKDATKPMELFIIRTSDIWFHPSVQFKCNHAGEQHHRENDESNTVIDKRGIVSVAWYMDQYWASPAYNPSWYSVGATLGLLNDVNVVYGAAGLSGFSYTFGGVLGNSWTTEGAKNSMLTYMSQWSTNANVSPYYNMVGWLVGNNVGGLAWLASACGRYGNYYKSSVSGLAYWSRLWTVKTIAHEFGHNRGANHDFAYQCGQSQGSGCQCSVMSYCFPNAQTAGGAVNYFSQTSINEIRATCN